MTLQASASDAERQLEGVRAEHESALEMLEKSVGERQRQILDEYDATLTQERFEREVNQETLERLRTAGLAGLGLMELQ